MAMGRPPQKTGVFFQRTKNLQTTLGDFPRWRSWGDENILTTQKKSSLSPT
jgi:hypothetical protein